MRRYALTGLVVCGICGRALDAHWTHGRAGYRCRHGRTSVSSPNPVRPRILYCREDHLVDLLQRNPTLACTHPRLPHASPAAIADELRHHHIVLVGDHDGWIVETEDTRMPLTPALLPAALHAKIPAQLDGDQH
ncbi:zinc ribbon domain-containing protein [Couchioplanes azureus]|uniref:zinc ribbon domain-containing protein n=1 Tax=Couchioplanes caeruleus TaxID=56438 RepID=UPI0019A4A261|nr:zinc ribbon domain-containing protein [Couchioplanes caeruleus]GGQ83935.1 hypothetical protein GCM10010166_62710 [Couchioplanes caeruleus subsp. azureus]